MVFKRKWEKGYFIVMMFFIMIILSALTATYSSFVIKQLEFAKQLENNIKIKHIAGSGVRYAKFQLKNNSSFRKTIKPVPCGEGEFTVQVIPENKYYVIKSKGRLGNLEKNIEYIYNK